MADRRELLRAFARTFGGEDGGAVLEDLREQFYDVPQFPEADYRAGRHDVVLYILEQVKRGQTNE